MRAWHVRGGDEGDEGWGLVKVRVIVGESWAVFGPPCHRICCWGWWWEVVWLGCSRMSGEDFILTVVVLDETGDALLLLLRRGMERMQDV